MLQGLRIYRNYKRNYIYVNCDGGIDIDNDTNSQSKNNVTTRAPNSYHKHSINHTKV
jgi:hypothetical protein